MAFAIDSEVRGCHVCKDFEVLAMGFCSPKSAIANTGKPLHTLTPMH